MNFDTQRVDARKSQEKPQGPQQPYDTSQQHIARHHPLLLSLDWKEKPGPEIELLNRLK